jgi:hypothetical protein
MSRIQTYMCEVWNEEVETTTYEKWSCPFAIEVWAASSVDHNRIPPQVHN